MNETKKECQHKHWMPVLERAFCTDCKTYFTPPNNSLEGKDVPPSITHKQNLRRMNNEEGKEPAKEWREETELALSEGIASIKGVGANKNGELLVKYLDVQNKVGEVLWKTVFPKIAVEVEQALARGRRELEKEYTHGYNVIKTGEHIYIHSRVVEAEKNQAFEAGKKEARTKNWEDYALGFGEGRAARDSELRVLIKARIVQTPMDTQSRMLQGKNEAFEDMLELLTKDTKSETQ